MKKKEHNDQSQSGVVCAAEGFPYVVVKFAAFAAGVFTVDVAVADPVAVVVTVINGCNVVDFCFSSIVET